MDIASLYTATETVQDSTPDSLKYFKIVLSLTSDYFVYQSGFIQRSLFHIITRNAIIKFQ